MNGEVFNEPYPRFPKEVFLPLDDHGAAGGGSASASSGEGVRGGAHFPRAPGEADPAVEDPRTPKRTDVLPRKIVHVHDARGENFTVYYHRPLECKDGIPRRTVWYRCRQTKVSPETEEGQEGHRKAEKLAWAHVQQVLESGGDPENVVSRFGCGELEGHGFYRYHGDAKS